MANPRTAAECLRVAGPSDPTLKDLKSTSGWSSYSIGGSGTVNVYYFDENGEIEGSAQLGLTITQEVGVMGIPGIIFPVSLQTGQGAAETNLPRAIWMEIIAVTGTLTWGLYGIGRDFDNTGFFLKAGSHRLYTLPIGVSLRIGPAPMPRLGTNGAVEVDPNLGEVPTIFNHNPGANTQATVTLAAPGAGRRWVITSLLAKLVAGATAPTAINVNLNIIGGSSGGTAVWSTTMSVDATAGRDGGFVLESVDIPIALNTACTVEFSVPAGANTFESINGTAKVVAG